MSYLENVNSPKDIKKLNIDELKTLCEEIRTEMIQTVSQNGGHLASNLGVVELTVALHKVFNSPQDQIVFDVGHQCYTHKLLTGRREQFRTLRQENGISGFVRPNESVHDIFSSGHSSVSISQAIGLAKAKSLKGDKGKVIAIIGDGALTGGLAYEALNNSGNESNNLVVILNDNNMSISSNVGSMAKNLTNIRTNPKYFTFRNKVTRGLAKIPKLGAQITRHITFINSKIRAKIYKSTVFEDLGFRYYGPIDGHDLDSLIDALTVAKAHNHSVLIHVNTVKGKGYSFAEKNPSKFHGIGKFDIETGESTSSGDNFSAAFGNALINLANNDSRICAVTAAMSAGTGLSQFAEKYPDRFFDVGIAEQNAVSMAAGMAKQGLVPVVAVYSSFLQRAYDMLIHDVALQNLHVVFGIDRAGLVGSDGETHHGVFDVSYLSSVPNIKILCPSNFAELETMLDIAVNQMDGPVAVRYPRGGEGTYKLCSSNKSDFISKGNDITIVTYGTSVNYVMEAADLLRNSGIKADLIKLNQIMPADFTDIITSVKTTGRLLVVEEVSDSGCIGSRILSEAEEQGISLNGCELLNLKDGIVTHGTVEELLGDCGLDAKSIYHKAMNLFEV